MTHFTEKQFKEVCEEATRLGWIEIPDHPGSFLQSQESLRAEIAGCSDIHICEAEFFITTDDEAPPRAVYTLEDLNDIFK